MIHVSIDEYNAMLRANETEDEAQKKLFDWLEGTEAAMIHKDLKRSVHIANEGKRTASYGAKLKQMGMRPGFPDIFVPIPTKRHCGLFIELKRAKGGRASKEQQDWIDYLNSKGYCACVCNGVDEAKLAVLRYLGVKNV
ncbi:MAG: VRR-NUC domain-containing protein [Ruminococcus sp.]|nr:VRR-NUC domain-containing protein [Ruminococcus sp.]